jgi:hypothetical protein
LFRFGGLVVFNLFSGKHPKIINNSPANFPSFVSGFDAGGRAGTISFKTHLRQKTLRIERPVSW